MIESFLICDADTHISPYKVPDKKLSREDLVASMKKNNVDYSLCWLYPHGVDNVSESNDYVGEAAAMDQHLIPFGWVNIREGHDKALKDAAICFDELHCRGIKINGAQNDYPIDLPDCLEVASIISSHNGMVAFHIGADSPDNTSPKRASVIAEAYPDMPVLMVHMGGAGEPDRSADVIRTAKTHSNMYLVGSAISVEKVRIAVDELGPDRVLFGSDFPFYDPGERLDEYMDIFRSYPSGDIAKILGLNFRRLFLS